LAVGVGFVIALESDVAFRTSAQHLLHGADHVVERRVRHDARPIENCPANQHHRHPLLEVVAQSIARLAETVVDPPHELRVDDVAHHQRVQHRPGGKVVERLIVRKHVDEVRGAEARAERERAGNACCGQHVAQQQSALSQIGEVAIRYRFRVTLVREMPARLREQRHVARALDSVQRQLSRRMLLETRELALQVVAFLALEAREVQVERSRHVGPMASARTVGNVDEEMPADGRRLAQEMP
jgi:hypothetical protein